LVRNGSDRFLAIDGSDIFLAIEIINILRGHMAYVKESSISSAI
jgi:hypothetical protein